MCARGRAFAEQQFQDPLKRLLGALGSLGARLKVGLRADVLRNLLARQSDARVGALVLVSAHYHLQGGRHVVHGLRAPAGLDRRERIGLVECRADDEQVGSGVREGTKAIIVLIARAIGQGDQNLSGTVSSLEGVVFEDRGHVSLRHVPALHINDQHPDQCSTRAGPRTNQALMRDDLPVFSSPMSTTLKVSLALARACLARSFAFFAPGSTLTKPTLL